MRGGNLYIIVSKGEISAFALLVDFPLIEACYISGIVKKPAAPSRIVEDAIRFHLNKTNPTSIVARTQNDRTIEILHDNSSCTSPIDYPPNQLEMDIITKMGLFHPQLNSRTLIVPNYYGSPMIEGNSRRRSKNESIRAATDRLNYKAGDAMIVIGHRG